ncbi:nucleoside recognition protein [Thermoactinomyces vulgaris]|jgi:spore maturation protein A|uniref:nucleoside recognition domain-containing protein n=1 Tax=Thermoactinomyces TaxID=2023 RepID=UPI0006734AB0|nr:MULTISPECIES: nucleoside recognition domain-containing protein [Thermoactinomyces]MBH8582267.1 nucleoside recognition protein [Thermoactinomyces sp. CICC 10735]MCF6134293.1 nucleoside recognition protein [Thermoactinomyces vulgaris]QBK14292.1 nucleoside recognition protein [Thermoactinomyces vulgaris]
MIHYIWIFMILSGVVAAALQGKLELVTKAALNGAEEGVSVCLGLISIMVFWLGMMRIAQDAGLLEKLSKILRPVARFLFPSVPHDHPAMGYILSNMSANLFGLGNAATPMGLKAMEELQKLNPDRKTATPAMCTLLALNTSGLTLLPTTIIGIRLKHGSVNPTEIIGPTLLATLLATSFAILLDRYYRKRTFDENGRLKK